MTATIEKQHPILARRLAAILYDTFLVLPLIMASVALSMGVRALLVGGVEGDPGQAELNPQLVQFIVVIATGSFFGWFWMRSGQTLGMQAWRIKLQSIDGRPITARMVITRTLAAILSAACVGAGYLWCLVDSERRCWHDTLSGTELVLLPKPHKKNKSTAKEKP